MRLFLEDMLASAGMKGTIIKHEQLEELYGTIDITNSGTISRLEMQKFLGGIFETALSRKLDVEVELDNLV